MRKMASVEPDFIGLAEKRLSAKQRAVLLGLSHVPQPLSGRDATSALCLEKVSIGTDAYVGLVRGYWDIHRLKSTYFAKLTMSGEQLAARLRLTSGIAARSDETRSGSAEGESPAPEGGGAQALLQKLTKSQSRILKSAKDNDDKGGHPILNLTEMRTVQKMERRGLVTHVQPTGHGITVWGEAKITDAGRARAEMGR